MNKEKIPQTVKQCRVCALPVTNLLRCPRCNTVVIQGGTCSGNCGNCGGLKPCYDDPK